MKIEGGCLCGKVRYSADAERAFVGVCHCKNCQKGTCTAFSVVVGLPTPALSVQGTLQTFTGRGDSGKATYRRFCPECGSALIDEAEVMPNVTMVMAGGVDDPRWGKAGGGGVPCRPQRAARGQPRRRQTALPENAARVSLIARPTLARLAADLAAGRTTSRALVEEALARIADPTGEGSRVFVKVYADAARAAAEAQDR